MNGLTDRWIGMGGKSAFATAVKKEKLLLNVYIEIQS